MSKSCFMGQVEACFFFKEKYEPFIIEARVLVNVHCCDFYVVGLPRGQGVIYKKIFPTLAEPLIY